MSDSLPTDTLILVPTELERVRLQPLVRARPALAWASCGFGPIAAAAATQYWLQRLRPRRVVLVGIAGSLVDSVSVGTAMSFAGVALDGVGAWQDNQVIAPAEMGFSQFDQQLDDRHVTIGDQLTLQPCRPADDGAMLLTVCAASGTLDMARERARRSPHAVAEDLEGFGVAVACRLSACPLTIIRGISNLAGTRDKREWHIDDALTAAAALLETWLTSTGR